MSLTAKQNRVREINRELAALSSQSSVLYTEKAELEKKAHVECTHKKIVYTDGHISHDPDDYDTPEVHICLGCGLTESGERKYNQDYSLGRTVWYFKVLTAVPVRRFCVPGRMMSDTVNYHTDIIDREVKYARERGEVIPGKKRDEMLEKELSKYWEHVKSRVFKLSYPARIKAVQRMGYPV